MEYRNLGSSEGRISEIGLGCWQFGGDFGAIEEERIASILSAAVDAGITFFDTADVYGNGRSERLIGAFLKEYSREIFVATKVGRSAELYPGGYTEASVRKQIEGSLERLGRSQLDLIQLHCVPTEVLLEGSIFGWLRKFQAEGLIAAFGASVESVEEGHICMREEGLASLQVIFNVFRQKPLVELFPAATANGVGIIVRLPLASGLLSGKFQREHVFAPEDHRHYNRDGAAFNVGETFAGLPFERGVELVETLRAHVPAGLSMAQWAQRWILDHPAVSTVITGASSPDQVTANAGVSDLPELPPATHAALSALYLEMIEAHIRGPY